MKYLFLVLVALASAHISPGADAPTAPARGLAISPAAAVTAASAPQTTIAKIMPLGDSITFGSPDPGYGGYRHLLGTLLANDGYPIDFVGSRESGPDFNGGPYNEGHPGWTIRQLIAGIDHDGWLDAHRPDIVLLHIGTNDIRQGRADSAPADLAALLDDILARLPQAHIIVAQIIPFRRGPEPGHQSYNAAIPGIVASRAARVSMVDMRTVLSPADYADGLHPSASGYDKIARAWEPAIRAVLEGSAPAADALPLTGPAPNSKLAPAAVAASAGPATAPIIRYIPGSTIKVEQLIGEEDKERHQPTLSRTVARYGIEGTDLGYSFESRGHAYFLFGDTVGRLGRALDTVATTDATDPERGVRLDFLMDGSHYLTVQPPGISMGAFEVPVSGISLGSQAYVVVSTNHSSDRSTDRSVLTRFTPPATFQPLRTLSQLPGGHFVKMSLHLEPESESVPGLPPDGPYVFIWGTGAYRRSDAFLAIVPAKEFETGHGTRYFAGVDARGMPVWSENESAAKSIVQNGTLGDLSVTWCKDLGLWLMTYDSRPPAARGVLFAYARAPWGPWSEPQVIFDTRRDRAVGHFIHDPGATPDDRLAGPVIGKGKVDPGAVHGGAYAPYVVERFTRLAGAELDLYYVLSTWNPYVVVLMKSRLHVE